MKFREEGPACTLGLCNLQSREASLGPRYDQALHEPSFVHPGITIRR